MMALASARAKTVNKTQIPALVETQVWEDKKKKKKKPREAKKQINNRQELNSAPLKICVSKS